jgi:hypothetical protein
MITMSITVTACVAATIIGLVIGSTFRNDRDVKRIKDLEAHNCSLELLAHSKDSSLTKKMKEFEIDKTLFDKEKANWKLINDAREARRDAQVEEGCKIAKLEAKREALQEIAVRDVGDIKELKAMLIKAIDSLCVHAKSGS